MAHNGNAHLARLADGEALATLVEMGFDWTPLDRNVCAALRFKRLTPGAPAFVGLLGGASSGKSTLFNSLIGHEVSRVSAHAHETLGPIVAVHRTTAPRVCSWIGDGLILADLEPLDLAADEPTTGKVGTACIHRHNLQDLERLVLFDTPDVTSKMSADEGSITRNLLPWFDAVLVVVDEERWFDGAVFEEIVEGSRNFGPQVWIVFNRTERTEALSPEEAARLARHADARHLRGYHVSSFQTGSGYRPVADTTRVQLVEWLSAVDGGGRLENLGQRLQRRAAALVRENVARGERFTRMCRAVDGQLSKLGCDASLSLDLLTAQERGLLGLGHRFLPLYDVFQHLRRRMRSWGLKGAAAQSVDFEKRTEQLAQVLRRNMEMRFRDATDRIDEVTTDSAYEGAAKTEWSNTWTPPPFDEKEWALRIRAHIEAWKEETIKQSRTGDVAAISVGMPLLVADLLFLGGAGVTLTWAAVWLTGFFGSKSLTRLVQRSPAFRAYQTTVRAYQSFIREALVEQWEANLTAMPRCHLKMTDPVLEAMMHWSTPRGR